MNFNPAGFNPTNLNPANLIPADFNQAGFNPTNLKPANINPTSFRIPFLTGLLSILTVDALHNRSFYGNFCRNFTGIVSRETRFSASHQEQEDIDVGR